MDRPAAYHGSSGLSITGGAEGASSAFRPSLPSEGAPSDAEAAPSLGHSEEQPPGGGEEVPGGPSSPSPRQTEGRPSSGREGEAVVVSPADTRRGEKPLSVYTAPQSAQHPARGDGCDPEAACDLVPWRLQTTKAQRRRSAALAGAAAAVRVPEDIQGTVLFRPAQRGTTFTRDQGWELAEELGSRPGVLAVRVNTRRGVVAADVGSDAALRELLAMSVIRGVAEAPGCEALQATTAAVREVRRSWPHHRGLPSSSPLHPLRGPPRPGRLLEPQAALHQLRRATRGLGPHVPSLAAREACGHPACHIAGATVSTRGPGRGGGGNGDPGSPAATYYIACCSLLCAGGEGRTEQSQPAASTAGPAETGPARVPPGTKTRTRCQSPRPASGRTGPRDQPA
ncbi:uncharacterized protein LOC144094060 [Amblyomma americanum]